MKHLFFNLTLLIFLFTSACQESEEQKCDCEGESIHTVTDMTGVIYHVENDSFPEHHYVIHTNNPFSNRPNSSIEILICNEDLFSSVEEPLIYSLDVKFSGELKNLCNAGTGNKKRYYITLESIGSNCGCSPTSTTQWVIGNSDQMASGQLYLTPNPERYDHQYKYVIRQYHGQHNMNYFLYVCNEDMLSKFNVTTEPMDIKFTGTADMTCSPPDWCCGWEDANIILSALE